VSSWFDRFGFAPVGQRLLVGAYPRDAADVERIAAAEVDALFNLCEDCEYDAGERDAVGRALARHGIEERRLPVVDYGGLDVEQLDRAIGDVEAWLDSGRTVYLHCRAGWQRSATVAAGVVARREGIGVDEALRVVRERKPTAEPLAHQRAGLVRWWTARR
jgi:atypical dual specificity phosphatase